MPIPPDGMVNSWDRPAIALGWPVVNQAGPPTPDTRWVLATFYAGQMKCRDVGINGHVMRYVKEIAPRTTPAAGLYQDHAIYTARVPTAPLYTKKDKPNP